MVNAEQVLMYFTGGLAVIFLILFIVFLFQKKKKNKYKKYLENQGIVVLEQGMDKELKSGSFKENLKKDKSVEEKLQLVFGMLNEILEEESLLKEHDDNNSSKSRVIAEIEKLNQRLASPKNKKHSEKIDILKSQITSLSASNKSKRNIENINTKNKIVSDNELNFHQPDSSQLDSSQPDSSQSNSSQSNSSALSDQETKKVLVMADNLLESLPEDVFKKFVNSEEFKLYKKVLEGVKK